jgi:quinolinate synthase
VLLPDLAAGCSLASTIDADQLRAWKAEHPGAVVVAYVNTTADVKAESDYCCTSGNAVEVVNAIDADREILFLPDMFLGAHVRRITGRENIHVWMGECHVHAGIDPEHINLQRAAHPGAEFLIHPECGCATPVVEAVSAGAIDAKDVHILSTEGMIKRPPRARPDEFIVATELGILHRLRRENPGKTFYAANDRAQCAYMKVTTLPKVRRALETMTHEITVPDGVAARARRAIERMVAIGGQGAGPALSPSAPPTRTPANDHAPARPSGSPSPNDLPFGGRVGDQLRSQEGPGGGSGRGGRGAVRGRAGTTGAVRRGAPGPTGGPPTAARPTGGAPSGAWRATRVDARAHAALRGGHGRRRGGRRDADRDADGRGADRRAARPALLPAHAGADVARGARGARRGRGVQRRDHAGHGAVEPARARAHRRAAAGVVAGVLLAVEAFRQLDPRLTVRVDVPDGAAVPEGTPVLFLSGHARGILSAERVALNFMQRLSGVASLTAKYVQAVAGTGARSSTRARPRRAGGGWRSSPCAPAAGTTTAWTSPRRCSSRTTTSPAVDGDVAFAVRRAREMAPPGASVEVECDTRAQVEAALAAGADVILLDNMSLDELRACAALCRGARPPRRAAACGSTRCGRSPRPGVDCISVGALTHSAPAMDLALDFE